MGHFLCGVETVKSFVNIRLRCNISNPKKIAKTSTLQPPGKLSADAQSLRSPVQQAFCCRTEDETNLHIILVINIVYS